MKMWMSAVIVVLISSTSVMAAEAGHEAAAVVAAPAAPVAKPVAVVEPVNVRLGRAITNACALQQGVTAPTQMTDVARSIGTDIR